MGYQYHQKRCGGEFSDDEKPVFLCQHCGKSYRSKAGRDYHVRTEHSLAITSTVTATTASNNKDNIPDSNNNTGKDRVRKLKICRRLVFISIICYFANLVHIRPQVVFEESPAGGKREKSHFERNDWEEKSLSNQREPREKPRDKQKERDRDKIKTAQIRNPEEDIERTPSGRVRRRSAQVAVFHLQEIAEDELAKDWGTKRRIKDDLVPDSKRVRRVA